MLTIAAIFNAVLIREFKLVLYYCKIDVKQFAVFT